MEIQIAVFGFVNRNKCLQRFYLEVLDGRYIRISKFMWEKGFDETGTVVPIIIFLVHETLGDIPHEMAEWDIGNLFRQPSCYRLRLVSVKVHPTVHLFADMVHSLFVSDTGHVEMNILHDHADTLFLFLLFPVLIVGTVLLVKFRSDFIGGSVLLGASPFVGIGFSAAVGSSVL